MNRWSCRMVTQQFMNSARSPLPLQRSVSMDTSARARLDRLMPAAAKNALSSDEATVPHYEKELIEYRQRQELAEEDFRRGQQPVRKNVVSDTPLQQAANPESKPPSNNVKTRQNHVPGTDPSQPLFLPQGVFPGGLSANTLNGESIEMPDPEPVSSSKDLVGRYCIWNALTKFPYKYMQDPNGSVSQQFFAAGKIYERNWNMHYMLGNESLNFKPLLLVTYAEVQQLMREISAFVNIPVHVPAYPFQMSFYNDGYPQPKLLGIINSRAELNGLVDGLDMPGPGHGEPPTDATKEQISDHEAWTEKIDRGINYGKKSKQAAQARKRGIEKIQNSGQLDRALRYLGLSQKAAEVQLLREDDLITQGQQAKLDLTNKVPYVFEEQVVFVAIDVEAWERDQKLITEIGISTLDTSDLVDVPPEEQGQGWIKKIRSRHIRINGTEDKVNHQFVSGAPDKFQFGQTEWYSQAEAAETVDGCFEHPFSREYECNGPQPAVSELFPQKTQEDTSHNNSRTEDHVPSNADQSAPRNVILLGHGISGDIHYLASLGSAIFGDNPKSSTGAEEAAAKKRRIYPTIRETIDTITIDKALRNDSEQRGLAKLCQDCDIDAWFLHNAGNDARYTMEVFVKMVIKARQQIDCTDATQTTKPEVKSDMMPSKPDPIPTLAQELSSRACIAPATIDEDDDEEPPY